MQFSDREIGLAGIHIAVGSKQRDKESAAIRSTKFFLVKVLCCLWIIAIIRGSATNHSNAALADVMQALR